MGGIKKDVEVQAREASACWRQEDQNPERMQTVTVSLRTLQSGTRTPVGFGLVIIIINSFLFPHTSLSEWKHLPWAITPWDYVFFLNTSIEQRVLEDSFNTSI